MYKLFHKSCKKTCASLRHVVSGKGVFSFFLIHRFNFVSASLIETRCSLCSAFMIFQAIVRCINFSTNHARKHVLLSDTLFLATGSSHFS